jgi:hypothetical protein
MLSKNFRSLLESMKSTSNEIDEDRDARIENREERKVISEECLIH